jgi:hypothetical protein
MSRGRTRWGGRAQCSQARRSRPPPAAREGQRLRTLSERAMSAATSRSSSTRSEGGLGDREAGSGEGSEGAAARQNKASPRKERGRGQQGPRSAARPRRRPPPPPPTTLPTSSTAATPGARSRRTSCRSSLSCLSLRWPGSGSGGRPSSCERHRRRAARPHRRPCRSGPSLPVPCPARRRRPHRLLPLMSRRRHPDHRTASKRYGRQPFQR